MTISLHALLPRPCCVNPLTGGIVRSSATRGILFKFDCIVAYVC